MECAKASSFLVTLPSQAFSGYRFSGAPGSTVVPSHGSPANLAGISKLRSVVVVGLQMWESLERFPSLALLPGVMCRPSSCIHLWYCWRAIILSFEQNRPGHARHLVG